MSELHNAPARSHHRSKAILAIAAGTALLIGGTGTYALWSTSETLTAGPIETGDLDLALGTGVWSLDGLVTAPATVADPAAVRIVPGDVLTLTQPLDVTLVGDTIAADLSVVVDEIVPPALASYITVDFASADLGAATGPNAFRITPADAGTIATTVTLTFSQTTPDRVATNTTVDLTAIAFQLNQAAS